jgi:divalent metal cation (Fe/Co/Zn/Cd) transporter
MRDMRVAAILAGLALGLAGCTNPNGTANNTGTDSLIGGGAGAAVGGLVGNLFGHNATATLIGAAIGGAAGYFAGSAIGQQLDAQDRELAAQNTTEVLDEPAPTPQPGHAVYVRHHYTHRWVSDHTETSGSATLEKVSVTPDGNECRLVRELAVINGKEVVQHTNYCQTASGSWKAEAA